MEYISLHGHIKNTYTFRHTNACRTPAESGQEYLTSGKEYIEPRKLTRIKELGGKTGVLVGLDLPSTGRGNEAGVQSPHWGNCLSQGETFKAESETADSWQPKWNENQKVLAIAIHSLDRDAGP